MNEYFFFRYTTGVLTFVWDEGEWHVVFGDAKGIHKLEYHASYNTDGVAMGVIAWLVRDNLVPEEEANEKWEALRRKLWVARDQQPPFLLRTEEVIDLIDASRDPSVRLALPAGSCALTLMSPGPKGPGSPWFVIPGTKVGMADYALKGYIEKQTWRMTLQEFQVV